MLRLLQLLRRSILQAQHYSTGLRPCPKHWCCCGARVAKHCCRPERTLQLGSVEAPDIPVPEPRKTHIMSIDTKCLTPASTNQPSKAQAVTKLLSRKAGATLANLTEATGWQPHSARAHLTGLRKKGAVILREKRKDGTTCWRITSVAPSAPKVEA